MATVPAPHARGEITTEHGCAPTIARASPESAPTAASPAGNLNIENIRNKATRAGQTSKVIPRSMPRDFLFRYRAGFAYARLSLSAITCQNRELAMDGEYK